MMTPRDLVDAMADRLYQMSVQAQHVVRRVPNTHYLDGDAAPVLLLPGVYETWQFLRPAADRLNALGHPIHLLTALGYNRLTVVESAALAQRYLDERGLTNVILLAHSKGGLIGKHMMVTDDRSARITQLIALNSPFGGSTLAKYAPVRTLRAFSPLDETVQTLAANLEANAHITSIFSRLDPLIPGGSRLEGATNVELPIVGHFRPLDTVQFFDEIERAITLGR